MISSWLLRVLPDFLRQRIAGRSYLLRVIDNTGWIFAERMLRNVLGFAVGVWIARYMGPAQYGLLNYASAFVLVFGFLGTLGFDSVAVRDIVRDPRQRDETLGTLILLRAVGGLIMVSVVAVAVIVVKPADPRSAALIGIIAVSQLLLATDAIDCWFQAKVSSHYTVIARLAALLSGALVRVGMILVHAPLVAFAWASIIECALLAVGMLVVYRRSGQRISRLRPSVARAKAFFSEGWPLLLSAAVVSIGQRFDQVLLGQLAGYAQVGAYVIAVRVIEVTYIIPAVVTTSVFPAMIKLKAQNAIQYEAQVQRLCTVMLWLAIAISVPLSLLAGVIVRLLVGSVYDGAILPLVVLSWMPVFVFFNLLRQRWLLAEQAAPVALAIEFAGCVLGIAANFLLIPRYGATGASLAALVGAVGGTLVVAPFSNCVRRSVGMMLSGLVAPVRVWRARKRYR